MRNQEQAFLPGDVDNSLPRDHDLTPMVLRGGGTAAREPKGAATTPHCKAKLTSLHVTGMLPQAMPSFHRWALL